MKKENSVIMLVAFIAMSFAVSSCKTEEPDPVFEAKQVSYVLGVKDVLGVSGTVTFVETVKGDAIVNVVLTGAPSGTHPAELCMNSAVEDGVVVVVLNPIDGTGKSSTTVTEMTYNELLVYDGCVRVRKGSLIGDQVFAIGDIGGNVITTTQKSYTLEQIGSFGVSGTALFEKRTNGNTLVTISLNGTLSGESYPATINIGSISTVGGGDIKKTLNPINGSTGKSFSNIRTLNNDVVIKYENWLVYDGYINIYQKSALNSNIISHGDIGSNKP